jgi:outer membrane protein OmpA-like peptidoglycan-associated protein
MIRRFLSPWWNAYYRILLFILFIFVCINYKPFASERNLFSIESNIVGFGNFYVADFNGFPNYACCSNFNSGFGLRYGLGFGGQWLSNKELFDTRFGVFFAFTYRDYSGKFEKEDYFADVIIDEKVYRAIARHTLEPKIQALDLALGTKLNHLLGFDNLNLKLGINLSAPLSSVFSQEERLLEPERANFENGSKVRNNYRNEKIPNVVTPQLALHFATEWKAASVGNFDILPTLVFNLPFFNFTKDVNWTIYSFGAGFTIRYNIPKPKPIPPVVPQLPDFPKPLNPPEPVEIACHLEVSVDGKPIESGETLFVKRITTKEIIHSFLPPFMFFERNDFAVSLDTFQLASANPLLFERNQKVLAALLKYLQRNPAVQVEILCSRLDDELSNVCQNRSLQVVEFLRSYGIAENRISTKEQVRKVTEFKSQELAEETRSLQFFLSDGTLVLDLFEEEASTTRFVAPKLEITPKCNNSTYTPQVSGVVVLNNDSINAFGNNPFLFDLASVATRISNGSILAFDAKFQFDDAFKTSKNTTKDFYILFEDSTLENTQDYRVSSDGKAYLFGLCSFDKKDFYWINPSIQQIIDRANKEGKKVRIAGSVDNIGGEGYNYNLAMERARSAKKLLGNDFEIYPKLFNKNNNGNSTPHERVLNRSAWLIVE